MTILSRSLSFAVALTLTVAAPLAAQTVSGRVADDSSGAPVAGVEVSLIDGAGRTVGRTVRSTDDGGFRLYANGQGVFRLSARRIGYAPLTTGDIGVGLGELVTVEIRLTRVAQIVAPVRIVARGRVDMRELMTTNGYDLRRTRGIGRFLGTDEMESAILRYGNKTTVGIIAESGESGLGTAWGGMEQIFRIDNRCTPHVYLDGFRVTSGGTNLAENAYARVAPIAASEIYGVEVYRGHEIPPASVAGPFGTEPAMDRNGVALSGLGISAYTTTPNTCGVIAVWTKGRMSQPGGLPGGTEPALRGLLVHDETAAPIEGAIVLLLTERGAILKPPTKSDSLGRFTVRIPVSGRFRLRAVHTSFDQVTTPSFRAELGESLVVELTMATEGQVRAPLTIQQKFRGGIPSTTPVPAAGPGAPPPPG